MEKIRKASSGDLTEVIHLLTDDDFGKTREGSSESYKAVFEELLSNEYFDVFVMERDEEIIGCYQMMYLPHLSFAGTKRAQVESVRIKSSLRGQGLGRKLMKHAIQTAQEASCGIFQLTSNKERIEANEFYCELGLNPTHYGYKLYF
ncbi:MAG: GNAT family N-acetyltransferase [Halobacteriovoraceae bacterium]|jgi:N-acetylglutamate synthase-like GNAT family acetyltransferase|nr:GNAT family N-acetyltransferase [Halobacteriovoraceae bacterium]